MERRDFLGAAAATGVSALAVSDAQAQDDGRQWLEMREYTFLSRDFKKRIDAYLGDALVPALNRIGMRPVGVFSPLYGSDSNTYHVLIPHNSIDTALSLNQRLLDDVQFRRTAADMLDASSENAGFIRIKSKLMKAFDGCPKVEVPPQGARIFELRQYESHTIEAAKRKIKMFNSGEIAVFRKTGLTPVFFGETIIGDRMPNLNYMLTFKDMTERDANWKKFVAHPEWKAMSGDAQYKDTVSDISDTILRPAGFSQI